uniref:Putative subunit of trna-specific adenosine-34 deaminase n=1 Tax=Xenopsylla cheopis TaxID=163159 RepID=A0A6M2DPF3_XENCH
MEPPLKRPKHAQQLVLSAVLADDYVKSIALTEVFVCKIPDKSQISVMIKQLNDKLPLPDLQHLKRCHKQQIIIAKCTDIKHESIIKHLIKLGISVKNLDTVFEVKSVASKPVKLRWQFEEMNKIWPCNFHPNKYTETLYNATLFTDYDLEKHLKYLKLALRLSEEKFYVNVKEERGAVVVDPRNDLVVAVGYDLRHKNPVQHCCHVLVDNVAKSQNGGAWTRESLFDTDPSTTTQLMDKSLNTNGVPDYFKDIILSLDDKYTIGSKLVGKPNNKEAPVGPYLCTGYDVYLTHEPCVFCAMALTHSRVSRVFYINENKSNGALGSVLKLHTVKDLNHRFEVFKCDLN